MLLVLGTARMSTLLDIEAISNIDKKQTIQVKTTDEKWRANITLPYIKRLSFYQNCVTRDLVS